MSEARFLLDSDIAIYILDDARSPSALRLSEHPVGSVVTSAVAYGEVMRGVRATEPQSVSAAERLFAVVPVMPFDRDIARVYAALPFRRGSFDRLIAAHAVALGLTLVTNNESDFSDIPGLRIENWAT